MAERDTKAAQSWLDKAAAADPKDLRPRIAKVDLLLAAGEKEPALSAAKELESQSPKSPIALQILGRTQLAAGDQAGAVATYRRLVALTPDQPRLTTNWGRC